jgi:hypothetical protein
MEHYFKQQGFTIQEIRHCNYTKVISLKGDGER